VTGQEVGRWNCDKCGKTVVAAGRRVLSFLGIGAFVGPCPWDCGAWINRGFRSVKPGQVNAYRAEDWDQRVHAPHPGDQGRAQSDGGLFTKAPSC
jgi:hypothetical protein